jgi:hypothetical protein
VPKQRLRDNIYTMLNHPEEHFQRRPNHTVRYIVSGEAADMGDRLAQRLKRRLTQGLERSLEEKLEGLESNLLLNFGDKLDDLKGSAVEMLEDLMCVLMERIR